MSTKEEKVRNAQMIAATAGTVGGLTYAFLKKKHFWGYVGYSILFGLIAGGITWAVAQSVVPNDEKK